MDDTQRILARTGLSTFQTEEQAIKPGEKGWRIDLARLTAPLVGLSDRNGHVGIVPMDGMAVDFELLDQWAATRENVRLGATPHPLSLKVLDTIDAPVKRPK